jgi:hypothetical protein
MQAAGLEWLFRLASEPKTLVPLRLLESGLCVPSDAPDFWAFPVFSERTGSHWGYPLWSSAHLPRQACVSDLTKLTHGQTIRKHRNKQLQL